MEANDTFCKLSEVPFEHYSGPLWLEEKHIDS